MQPIVNGLENTYGSQIDFIYIDRENPANEAIVEKYGIRYQPVYILLNADGEIHKQWFGGVSKDMFETSFNEVLQ